VQQCWMVPERLKVTHDPEFTEHARENYIIDDYKICDDDAEGYFSDGSLPSDKKEEVSDEYIFDHLQDDITDNNNVEGKGCNYYNEFDAEGNDVIVDPVRDVLAASNDEVPKQSMYKTLSKNNDFVHPVCNVLVASNDEGPKQCIEKTLSKKNLAKITTPDVPMNLRKSPPEQLIHQSTTQNMSLTVDLQESSSEEEAEESDTESQLDAKYEANMRALCHALCNWQFEKCYLSNQPAMGCQFKYGCRNFVHKRCSILWSRTHGRNVDSIESLGHLCQEHYMDYDKEVLPTQTNNGMNCFWAWPNTERDHEWSEEDMIEFTANGLWFAPDCEKCFRTNKYLTHGDKLCGHSWQPHRLDKTGDCILFPSLCWHKGFYHDKCNHMFIQAQLFAAPLMGKDMGCLTRSFAGKDFINGNLGKSLFSELTNNVFTRWDESYPLLEFPPCSEFQDKDVDPVENCHIPQDKFDKVPLIQELVL
jgi:hypothetical protein